MVYGDKKTISSGPTFKSLILNKNKLILSFDNVGDGLVIKSGSALKYFAVAGADKKFVWAKAEIQHSKVLVWSEEIANPVYVRYAWADNPEGANLYNRNGLPTEPFEASIK